MIILTLILSNFYKITGTDPYGSDPKSIIMKLIKEPLKQAKISDWLKLFINPNYNRPEPDTFREKIIQRGREAIRDAGIILAKQGLDYMRDSSNAPANSSSNSSNSSSSSSSNNSQRTEAEFKSNSTSSTSSSSSTTSSSTPSSSTKVYVHPSQLKNDVEIIAKNTGFSREIIQKVKDALFGEGKTADFETIRNWHRFYENIYAKEHRVWLNNQILEFADD